MSRVMLFVQGPGDKRPKCAKSFGPAQGLNRARAHAYCTRIVNRRWWLVECANAEAGRAVIAAQGQHYTIVGTDLAVTPMGRILATGGEREGGEA